MNVLLQFRASMRWVAGSATVLALLGTAYGLTKRTPFTTTHVWLAALALMVILALWTVIEAMVLCTDQIIAAQPKARPIVAATLQAIEEERDAAREAGLRIIGGERLQ